MTFPERHTICFLHETAALGGAEESLYNLIAFLDRTRFEPFLIVPEEGPLCDLARSVGVEVIIVPMPKVRLLRGVFAAARTITRLLKDHSCRLVHSNSIRTHFYAAYAAKRLGIPLVWHERNLITTETIDPDRLLSFLPSAILCNSGAIAGRFMRSGVLPEKVRVIYNGVDTRRFSPSISGERIRREYGIRADELVIGIASRFAPDKGHETFFRAARSLVDSSPDMSARLRFLVAGGAVFTADKAREDLLRALVRGLGLEDRVVFTGVRRDMPEIYAAMDIFVLASDAEPCGRVLFESMASGKPVVATKTGGTPEIVLDGETGFLVAPGQPDEFARSLMILAGDAAERKAMGQAARRRIETMFSIGKNVCQIEEVYKKLLPL